MVDSQSAALVAAACFKIFISLALRGSISDIGVIISFMRESKRDVIDRNRSSNIVALPHLFWMYTLYLLTKRWEIDTCNDLLANFTRQFSQPQVQACLKLMDKQPDLDRLPATVASIENGQAALKGDLDWQTVGDRLKNFFAKITQQRLEDLDMSLERIDAIEQNKHEIASIIKPLCRLESLSRSA